MKSEKEIESEIADILDEFSSSANNGQMNVITEDSYSDVITALTDLFKQQPQPVTMWDVNHLGLREELIKFGYKVKGRIHHYYTTWKGEWKMEEVVDEYIEHRKREQEAADEDYRKNGKAT